MTTETIEFKNFLAMAISTATSFDVIYSDLFTKREREKQTNKTSTDRWKKKHSHRKEDIADCLTNLSKNSNRRVDG